ncbi:glycoside hydrolase family 61 protein [Tulasnella calospora MUT 4182]|uniref:Glycoside hydrolase family 61 protein n=1 Tax=Tulasnella calospora MUT 4182 TaxID=1051891 RepID=A0A0C3L948_9AGAM|nr:glycoside hydrolase family 61 protein [Tulasnella calospora MUT 4182]
MQAFAAQYTTSQDPVHRGVTSQILAYVPRLILDQSVNVIVGVLERGLAGETIPIQLSVLKVSSAFLATTDKDGKERGARLIAPMLNTLPPLPKDSQEASLRALIPLASTGPQLFRPHLSSLISFLPTLITRTPSHDTSSLAVHAADLEEDPTRYAALELLISITENDSKAVQACSEWTPTLVQSRLEGLAKIHHDVDGDWLDRDPTVEGDEDGYPTAFGKSVVAPREIRTRGWKRRWTEPPVHPLPNTRCCLGLREHFRLLSYLLGSYGRAFPAERLNVELLPSDNTGWEWSVRQGKNTAGRLAPSFPIRSS